MPDRVSALVLSPDPSTAAGTVEALLAAAAGEVEVVVVLEGAWASPGLPEDPRVVTVFRGQPVGFREALRAAAVVASGSACLVMNGRPIVAAWDREFHADYLDRRDYLEESIMAKTGPLVIARATYGIGEKDGQSVDVTEAVTRAVWKWKALSLKVTNEALGATNPPPFAGQRKRLTVSYTLNGVAGIVSALERKTLAIPPAAK